MVTRHLITGLDMSDITITSEDVGALTNLLGAMWKTGDNLLTNRDFDLLHVIIKHYEATKDLISSCNTCGGWGSIEAHNDSPRVKCPDCALPPQTGESEKINLFDGKKRGSPVNKDGRDTFS